MPHTTKKQRLDNHPGDSVAAFNEFVTSFDDLGVDLHANIFGYLTLDSIMSKRLINKKMREAVKKTIVPLADFCVESVEEYNAMNVMTRAMPNLQQITLRGLGRGHKYSDGEDPDDGEDSDEEEAARTANYTTHDIGIISNFRKLRIFKLNRATLNGRYPSLFNFPLLQELMINYCPSLKWDLEMLSGMPLLKELNCVLNRCMTGNINSLRVLKDTLEKVNISSCDNVEGNFMDLADFPHLKEVNLRYTSVTGDIRDIGNNDFSSLENLNLPSGVYGGMGYELQHISDGFDVIRAVYFFNKQRPELEYYWYGKLSEDSPDWYDTADFDVDYIQFSIHFVKAGPRLGYQWQTNGHWCEVNWLDPEPDKDSSVYGKYIEKLRKTEKKQKVDMFTGLHEPPTEEEYNRLLEEYDDESSDGSEEYDSEDEYIWEYNASDDDW